MSRNAIAVNLSEPVNMVLDLSTMSPELDDEGNLTIRIPIVGGPVFTGDAVASVRALMGDRMADIALDAAAHTLMQHQVSHLLSAKLR